MFDRVDGDMIRSRGVENYTREFTHGVREEHKQQPHHPDICRDENSNFIVYIIYPVVVIKDESPLYNRNNRWHETCFRSGNAENTDAPTQKLSRAHLHPSFPFLRLISPQDDHTWCPTRSPRRTCGPCPGHVRPDGKDGIY